MINEETIRLDEIKNLASRASFYKTENVNILKKETIDKLNEAITTIILANDFTEEVWDAYLFLKKMIPLEYFIAPVFTENDSKREERYFNYKLKLLIELCVSYLKDFGHLNNDVTKSVRYYFSILTNHESMPEEINESIVVLENLMKGFYGVQDEDLYKKMEDKLVEFKKKNK